MLKCLNIPACPRNALRWYVNFSLFFYRVSLKNKETANSAKRFIISSEGVGVVVNGETRRTYIFLSTSKYKLFFFTPPTTWWVMVLTHSIRVYVTLPALPFLRQFFVFLFFKSNSSNVNHPPSTLFCRRRWRRVMAVTENCRLPLFYPPINTSMLVEQHKINITLFFCCRRHRRGGDVFENRGIQVHRLL